MLVSQEPKYQAKWCADGEARLVNRATNETIPDDEPVFIFRARDVHLRAVLRFYADKCRMPDHQDLVETRLQQCQRFALEHTDRMHEPGSHPHIREGQLDDGSDEGHFS